MYGLRARQKAFGCIVVRSSCIVFCCYINVDCTYWEESAEYVQLFWLVHSFPGKGVIHIQMVPRVFGMSQVRN